MNKMNLPEEQLRSWRLRQPSARLKDRIFHTPASSHTLKLDIVWTIRWLAPAAACLMLAVGTFSYRGHLSGALTEESFAPTGSLEVVMQRLSGDYQSPHNSFATVTFGWTNRNGSTSSNSSFLPGKLN